MVRLTKKIQSRRIWDRSHHLNHKAHHHRQHHNIMPFIHHICLVVTHSHLIRCHLATCIVIWWFHIIQRHIIYKCHDSILVSSCWFYCFFVFIIKRFKHFLSTFVVGYNCTNQMFAHLKIYHAIPIPKHWIFFSITRNIIMHIRFMSWANVHWKVQRTIRK